MAVKRGKPCSWLLILIRRFYFKEKNCCQHPLKSKLRHQKRETFGAINRWMKISDGTPNNKFGTGKHGQETQDELPNVFELLIGNRPGCRGRRNVSPRGCSLNCLFCPSWTKLDAHRRSANLAQSLMSSWRLHRALLAPKTYHLLVFGTIDIGSIRCGSEGRALHLKLSSFWKLVKPISERLPQYSETVA